MDSPRSNCHIIFGLVLLECKTISVMIGDENSSHSFDDLSVKSGEATYLSGPYFFVQIQYSY